MRMLRMLESANGMRLTKIYLKNEYLESVNSMRLMKIYFKN